MSLELVTPPTAEPVTLDEAKQHLCVLNSDQDSLILSLVRAATTWCEAYSRQTLLTTTWKQRISDWPSCGVIEIYRPPLVSVTSVQYVDTNGTTQTLASNQYVVDVNNWPGRVLRAYGVTWPSLRYEGVAAPIAITYVAGRTDASNVPEPFKHAIKLMVGHWWEHREEVNVGSIVTPMPAAARALLDAVGYGSYP